MSPSMIQHVKCLACNSLVSLVNVDEWWMCKIGKTIQPSKTCWNQVTWTWMDCMVTACSYQRTSQTRSASTTSGSISPILTIRKPEGLLAFSQTLQAPTMKQQLLLTISYVAPLVKAFTCCQPVASHKAFMSASKVDSRVSNTSSDPSLFPTHLANLPSVSSHGFKANLLIILESLHQIISNRLKLDEAARWQDCNQCKLCLPH